MAKKQEVVAITPPNFQVGEFDICGTAPFVQHKFSAKSRNKMLADQQRLGGTKGKGKRDPRDLDDEYLGAMHLGEDGSHGIPCAAFRSAMIDACRAAGFQMTKAKMSVFCLPDMLDADDGTPLVKLTGEPERIESSVRLESGVASVAIRPMWREWSATVRLQWDGDQFGFSDVGNLLARAGMQVGVGEGRPFSKKSHGMGWGTFRLV
jgi:hypothetical protein